MPSSAAFRLLAWVDESIVTGRAGIPGTYTMAAVVTDEAACADLRHAVRRLSVRPGVRLHWVTESVKRRDVIATAISTFDVAAVVAVGAPMANGKQERARRCCLERLLYELDQLGVEEVWLESRRDVQDRRDVRLVDAARLKRLITRRLVVRFARPADEPLLWLPDAVAGAVSAEVLGDGRWAAVLSGVLTRVAVEVR